MVEFAIVIVVFLIFVFGAIEFARLLFEWNRTVEATRAGVRAAVVSDPPSSCQDKGKLDLQCPDGTPAACKPDDGSRILQAMKNAQPLVEGPDNVWITYSCSGTGWPDRPSPIPVVTVEARDLTFQFIVPGLLGLEASIAMPSSSSSQTGEDLEDTPVS